MLYFQLPSLHVYLYKQISIKFHGEEDNSNVCVSSSLSYFLCDIKKRIDHQEHEWDVCKRYTNPFEYIHTTIPDKKRSVSKYKPLSRSYFKMIEITQYYRLLDKVCDEPFQSFHLAEGPGGFIEALCHMRNNENDKYIGMTILNDVNDPNIPGWKKSQQFLKDHKNVYIENGADKTGNILSLENFDYCYHNYKNSMQIITGDGGFDFSVDFNKQEQNISALLFGQICYALVMQKYRGCFILKIFDCFMQHTLDLLALLSSCYEKVYITKPQTSRYANSEKYVVCKYFQYKNSDDIYRHLRVSLNHLLNHPNKSLCRYLAFPLNAMFLGKMEECNAIFGQQQIENIQYTLTLILENQEKKDYLIKSNIQKCVSWCSKYNVSHHPFFS
jgi:23S rRNA U2552 (ribose-2'-O)-methylase RlmE/FtsJ